MRKIIVNCDIGERGAGHAVDHELMEYIQVANLAAGGHAGDAESIAAFLRAARRLGVTVSAHLSYPDRAHFGRVSLDMPAAELQAELSRQWERLGGAARLVKFHGALYNDACVRAELAAVLVRWALSAAVAGLIAPDDSEMAVQARAAGLEVWSEAFAERRYQYAPGSRRPVLVGRALPHAVIAESAEALRQAAEIVERGRVRIWDESGRELEWAPLAARTICIHSDAAIALELARALHERYS